MCKLPKFNSIFIILTTILILPKFFPLFAAELQMFSNVRFVDNQLNDGDSFFLEADSKSFYVRLYFVDCAETSAESKSDTKRIQEQTRYFGLCDPAHTIHFGNKAKIFVKHILDKTSFTLHTAFATAPGRSSKGRIYGFITTSDGNDLATLLIENGLARTYGLGRKTPSGIARNEMIERLRDLETSAMLKRVGIWAESDPDQIVKLRAKQRKEDSELKELQNQIKKTQIPECLIDLNNATETELQFINGIGPVLAARIIAERPYKNIEDLIKVHGVGPKLFEKIRPYIKINKKP